MSGHDFKTQPPVVGAPSLGQIPPVTPQQDKPAEETKKNEERNDAKHQDDK